MNFLHKIYRTSIFFILIGILSIDIISFFYPTAGKFGVLFWYASYFLLIIFTASCLREIKEVVSKKYFTGVIALFLICFITLININNIKNLSGETTQEVSCILNHLRISYDAGFRQTCMFGYPARQFYLPAVPSIVFGRSLFSLNFGMSLYFFIGIIIFSSGILNYLNKTHFSSLILGIILSSLLHVYFFNFLLFNYEQSIFPFSFSLTLCGLFLFFLKNQKIEVLGLIAILIYYTIFSYTPSLSLYFLSTAVLLFFLYFTNLSSSKKIVILGILIFSIIILFISSSFRQDIKLISKDISISQSMTTLSKGLRHLLFQSEGLPLVSPIFNFIFLFILFTCLLLVYGWQLSAISLWIILTMAISILSHGYAIYSIDYMFFRSTVIFPVLFTMFIKIFQLQEHYLKAKTHLLLALILFLYLTGFYYQFNYLDKKDANRHLVFINSLSKELKIELSKKSSTFYIDKNAATVMLSLNDSLTYFFPKSRSILADDNCANLRDKTANSEFLLIRSARMTVTCAKQFMANAHFISVFNFKNDPKLIFYRLNK